MEFQCIYKRLGGQPNFENLIQKQITLHISIWSGWPPWHRCWLQLAPTRLVLWGSVHSHRYSYRIPCPRTNAALISLLHFKGNIFKSWIKFYCGAVAHVLQHVFMWFSYPRQCIPSSDMVPKVQLVGFCLGQARNKLVSSQENMFWAKPFAVFFQKNLIFIQNITISNGKLSFVGGVVRCFRLHLFIRRGRSYLVHHDFCDSIGGGGREFCQCPSSEKESKCCESQNLIGDLLSSSKAWSKARLCEA